MINCDNNRFMIYISYLKFNLCLTKDRSVSLVTHLSTLLLHLIFSCNLFLKNFVQLTGTF